MGAYNAPIVLGHVYSCMTTWVWVDVPRSLSCPACIKSIHLCKVITYAYMNTLYAPPSLVVVAENKFLFSAMKTTRDETGLGSTGREGEGLWQLKILSKGAFFFGPFA